jgi:hypothetical protein
VTVDFWAQHKDFILKVLAGVGVFLVALIARSITYGDELEKEQGKNTRLTSDIASKKIPKRAQISELNTIASRLKENTGELAGQVGWNLGKEARKAEGKAIEQVLIERILRRTRKYARESEANVTRAAEVARAAIKENLNGGFGQLRLTVRKELVEEASEKSIKVAEGIGFDNATALEQGELMQYLLQLELATRVARYMIDARVDSIGEIGITTAATQEVIPGAHPEFIREYEVTFKFMATVNATRVIIDRLEQEAPRPALTALRLTREKRPANRVTVEMTLLATACDPEVKFAKEKP